MTQISWDDFMQVELRAGTIVAAEPFPEARKPAWKLTVDFGVGDWHTPLQCPADSLVSAGTADWQTSAGGAELSAETDWAFYFRMSGDGAFTAKMVPWCWQCRTSRCPMAPGWPEAIIKPL